MKRLQKTEYINKLLTSTVGTDVDTSNHPVYEVVATSNVPLRGKDGTIFENAVINPNTLFQLAAWVNRDPLPVMMDHNMEGSPYGKFFYAEVTPNEFGFQELRGFKYLDPTESNVIAKVDNGTIDEVSIAFAAREMKCNKCGWDYATAIENDNIMPIFERTCENGHKIGKDGTHLELEGVRETLELSLVSRGAAKNSKIIGQTSSKLSKQVEQLAAHGLSINDIYVTASASKGFDDMDMKDLIVELSDAKAKASTAEHDRDRMEKDLAKARGELNESQTRVNELEAELAKAQGQAADAPTAEERAKAEEDAQSTKAAVDYLTKEFRAVMAAMGKADAEAPETVGELVAAIDENKSELTDIIPVNGRSVSASASDDTVAKQDYSVFKSKNRQR
jgi:hypothetical protein